MAIMVRNLENVKRFAEVNEEEENLLTSPQRPIVLLKKKNDIAISEQVAPGIPNFGVMLPYTPLHSCFWKKILMHSS